MTTITGVGPALALNGPLPVARRYNLLKTPGVIVEDIGPEGPRPDWMNGVNVWGFPAGVPLSWEPCSVGTFRVKEESAVGPEDDPMPGDRFDPFVVYFPLQCSAISAHYPAFADRAKAVLNATISHAVERALSGGVGGSNNRFFGDTNLDVLATNVSPQIGLSYLENAIGFHTGRQGMIHGTPGFCSALGFNYLREVDPDSSEPEVPDTLAPADLMATPQDVEETGGGDEYLVSADGTLVVSGSGYIGVHPVGQPGPGATKDWIFATGPVEVRLGDGPTVSLVEALDRTENIVTFYPERFVVADWDNALQVAVLVDWSLQ